jgi:MarR family transcriptional regulator, organic hydroperoxide resistance regulator
MKERRDQSTGKGSLDLGDFLCFAVYSANHAFNRIYQPLLLELDLTYPQFITMILLWGKDDQTVGEIGESLFLQSNTLTPLLKRLEALGYVDRGRDPDDERQVRIRLTAAGRKLRLKASDIVRSVRVATGLAGNDMSELVEEIGSLRKRLEARAKD